jgi:zinc transport system substrate-binding protein
MLVGSLALTASLGCAESTPSSSQPLVLVTIEPLQYFVRGVGGDAVRVETLLPPGANPHAYEPGIAQLRSLDEAALLVTVGHPGLAFERAILERLPETASIVAGFAGIQTGLDPHLWLSPPNARVLVRNLVRALGEALPEQAHTIERRGDSLITEIDNLDKELRSILAISDRTFYVFHDSWGSFAGAYGLEQIAIEQEGHEPGPERIATIIEAARRDSVRSIFTEPQVSGQSAALVAEEVGADLVVIDPLAGDWSDNLIRVATAIAEGSR